MGYMKEKVAYLKGLAEGMNIGGEGQGKLLNAMISTMDEMADAIDENEAAMAEIDECLDDIYDELDNIDDYLSDDEDEDEDEEDDDEAYEDEDDDEDGDGLIEYECPHCGTVIFFDENGNFDDYKTDKVMAERLSHVEKAVIPGFYGSDFEGNVKTFSRGGSDITGSIVSKAVHASVYENWTDVSGCLVADPRIVENAQPIKVITYRELRELSYMGASVLHEDAIFPVRKAGIPINIKNTNAPEEPGTMIVESTCQKADYTITGIAGKRGFVAVNIDKDMMNSEVGFCRKALEAFEENGISIEHMPSGIDTMTVFVHQEEFEGKEQQVISSIRRLVNPDIIDLEADLALIAVVGRGMKSTRGTAGRIFSALAHAHINVKMIDQGSSELNIIVGLCLGHGLLFEKHSAAPVTTFLVKDFATGHKTAESLV